MIDSIYDVFELREELENNETKMIFMRQFVSLFRKICENGISVVLANNCVSNIQEEDLSDGRKSQPKYFGDLMPGLGRFWSGLIKERYLIRKLKVFMGEDSKKRSLKVQMSQYLKKKEMFLEINGDGIFGIEEDE